MPPLLLHPRPVAFTHESKEYGENKMSSSGKYAIVGANDLAERMLSDSDFGVLLVDCRSLLAFNCRHIKGAIHINCTGIGRKRLSQGKAKLKDLISSSDGKERFSNGEIRTIVVYDEYTSEVPDCTPCRPIVIVLQTLAKEGKDISVLKGRRNLNSSFVFGERSKRISLDLAVFVTEGLRAVTCMRFSSCFSKRFFTGD